MGVNIRGFWFEGIKGYKFLCWKEEQLNSNLEETRKDSCYMLNCIHKVFFFFDLYEIYVIEQAQRRENQLLTAEFYFAPSVG